MQHLDLINISLDRPGDNADCREKMFELFLPARSGENGSNRRKPQLKPARETFDNDTPQDGMPRPVHRSLLINV